MGLVLPLLLCQQSSLLLDPRGHFGTLLWIRTLLHRTRGLRVLLICLQTDGVLLMFVSSDKSTVSS